MTTKNQANNGTVMNQDTLKNLIYLAQNDCEESKNELLKANERLVYNIVNRYRNHKDYEDLIQLGRIGLLKSIEKFNLELNLCFSTYAVPVILGEVKRHFRDYKTIRVSRQIQEDLSVINKFIKVYVQQHQKDPRISDIVKGTELEEERVILAIGSEKDLISLNKSFGESQGNPTCMLDSLIDKTDAYLHFENRELIQNGMAKLLPKERKIIFSRYILEHTQTELAEELGISQAHVSRLEKKALKKIKQIV
ncbi:hypothetical protein CN918_32465 [Priestia megaterium]|nr:hypothetical protein CN918_32465 [Priestia megaterium]